MNKVWLHTFWLGWGEIQPAALVQPVSGEGVQPVLQRAWMRSVHPPYYVGVGIGVRLGHKTLRFGICHPRGPLTLPERDAVIAAALFSREIDREQEGQWHSEDRSA